jgi:uncharacterized protein
MIRHGRIAWSTSVRLVGWLPALGSGLAVAFFLTLYATIWRGDPLSEALPFLSASRVVETIVPLAVGLQAAFLLSPEDERPLELLLASPRTLPWTLLERLAVLAVLQGIVGLIGSLVGQWVGANQDPFPLLMARWIAPSIFIGGVVLLITQLTRKGTLGVLVALLLWLGLLLGGDVLLDRIFFSWPIHAFMQPGNVVLADYARNRIALILIGLSLIALAACVASDEERMLGVRQPVDSRWSHWLRLLLVGLGGGLALFYLGYLALWVDVQAQPTHTTGDRVTPADVGLDYEEVTFTSGDGVTLSGWYIPSRNGAAVILLYDVEHAEILARHGYGVLMYDLRGSGESEGDVRALGWLDVDDVAAAFAFLQSRDDLDPRRIGMMGFSLGGQIALRATAQMDGIRAVVADGPSLANYRDVPPPVSIFDRVLRVDNWLTFKFLAWRTGVSAPPAVVEVIADIAPRPIFLISTGQDIEQRMARYYYERAGHPKSLWEIPETGHGGGLATRPDEYEERIVLFFDTALLGDGGSK